MRSCERPFTGRRTDRCSNLAGLQVDAAVPQTSGIRQPHGDVTLTALDRLPSLISRGFAGFTSTDRGTLVGEHRGYENDDRLWHWPDKVTSAASYEGNTHANLIEYALRRGATAPAPHEPTTIGPSNQGER